MVNEQAKKIGERIKHIRMQKNLPQAVVAGSMGVSQSLLSSIESGCCSTTVDNLIKLHEILDCPMRDFFVDIDGAYAPELPQGCFSLEELAGALASLRGKGEAPLAPQAALARPTVFTALALVKTGS